MRRYGMIIGLVKDKIEEYRSLHAAAWPDVLRMIRQCHIQNYSIYLRTLEDGRPYLFSYFEYTGSDFEADMAKMAADPTTHAGGLSASRAKALSPTALPANGGLRWKKCFTWIESLFQKPNRGRGEARLLPEAGLLVCSKSRSGGEEKPGFSQKPGF